LHAHNEHAADEIQKFLVVFKANYHDIFGNAKYHQNYQRQARLRRPAALPDKSDVKALKVSTRSYSKNCWDRKLVITLSHDVQRLLCI